MAGNLDWEVKLDDTAYKSGSSGAGSKQTVEILNVSQGMHTFAVTVTAGKAKSEKAFENRYIGFDTPLAPANARLTQDGLFWDVYAVSSSFTSQSRLPASAAPSTSFDGSVKLRVPDRFVYAPKENVFYWNKYEGEESLKSSLVTLDVVTRTSKTVRTYTNEEQFSVYVCTRHPHRRPT